MTLFSVFLSAFFLSFFSFWVNLSLSADRVQEIWTFSTRLLVSWHHATHQILMVFRQAKPSPRVHVRFTRALQLFSAHAQVKHHVYQDPLLFTLLCLQTMPPNHPIQIQIPAFQALAVLEKEVFPPSYHFRKALSLLYKKVIGAAHCLPTLASPPMPDHLIL